MDSMSSNLKATLPLNVDEDPELLNHFKDSALSISSLFKHAQFSRRQTFANGYGTAITDIVDYIQAAAKDVERAPITIGGIISFLEQRQQALLKDLDRSSTTKPAHISRSNTTTKSPTPTDRQSPAASDTTATKRRKSPPASITVDKQPSPAPALSSLPIRAWDTPSWTQHVTAPSWPDLSLVQPIATIPAEALPLVVPALGSKRKREALLEVDLTNGTRPHINVSRKRRTRNNYHAHAHQLSNGGPRYDDWMDTDEEGRERKRVVKRV